MKPRLLALVAIPVIGLSAWWVMTQANEPNEDAPPHVVNPAPRAPDTPANASRNAAPASPQAAPIAAAEPVVTAVESLAHAREHGDERVPPLDTAAPDLAASPTAWDLSSPERYEAYEQQQQQRVKRQFLDAADQELPQRRDALAQARAQGASAADIEAAEEKIRRLEAMQLTLRSGAPLGEQISR